MYRVAPCYQRRETVYVLQQKVAAAGGALSPPNSALLTQQGGTLLFRDETTMFRQDDSGILKYTSLTDLTAAIAQAKQTAIVIQSQV